MKARKLWLGVLTDLRNRRINDVLLICDGLKGPLEVVRHVWPLARAQSCIIPMIRNTFRLAPKKDWDALRRDMEPI